MGSPRLPRAIRLDYVSLGSASVRQVRREPTVKSPIRDHRLSDVSRGLLRFDTSCDETALGGCGERSLDTVQSPPIPMLCTQRKAGRELSQIGTTELSRWTALSNEETSLES